MPSALSHDPSISTPGASTDNAIVIFDGTGGTGFGNSTILVDSGGNGRIGIAADTDIITVTAETVTIAGKLVATSIDVGDGAVTVDVTQSNHSLTVGMPIKVSGANQYAAAQADSAANAEVVGIVTAVASSSAFTMTLAGEITTAGAVPNSTSPGDIVYLSTSAGAVTTTEPSTAGQVSKPIAVITEANNKMIMLPFRGEVISSATDSMDLNGTELVLDADADTSITADTDDQIDIKISGADDFRFTANNFNILSGSTITIDSGATITNSGTANGFGGGDLSFGGDTFGENKVIGANDAYSLSLETSGNTALTIAATGEVTMPLQPAIFVRRGASATNVTGAGTVYTMVFTTEVFDQNADYDATSTFTAPVTGRYHMDVYLDIASMTSSANAFLMDVVMSNRSLSVNTLPMVANPARYAAMVSMLVDMDAADTLQVRLTVSGESSNIVDINSNTSLGIYLAA